jgi:pyruvate kinase
MRIRIICTLGPASMDPRTIEALTRRGVDLFRINLSHTAVENVEAAIRQVRDLSPVPLSLDTEGAQVRCRKVDGEVRFEEGRIVELTSGDELGTAERIALYPGEAVHALREGTLVSIDFHGVVLRVCEVNEGGSSARAIVERPGWVGSNKGVAFDPAARLPPLTAKDEAAIRIGVEQGIRHFALSFASSGEDVRSLRQRIPPDAQLIAKVESRAGVRNMDSIIEATDVVLIDRGDLSREIPFEDVPYYQKAIVRRANRWNRPVYVATNLLESMITNPNPTIAEANDIANTLLDGAHGLVLAAETAIGIDPVGAVDMIRRFIDAFEREGFSRFVEAPIVRGHPEPAVELRREPTWQAS